MRIALPSEVTGSRTCRRPQSGDIFAALTDRGGEQVSGDCGRSGNLHIQARAGRWRYRKWARSPGNVGLMADTAEIDASRHGADPSTRDSLHRFLKENLRQIVGWRLKSGGGPNP